MPPGLRDFDLDRDVATLAALLSEDGETEVSVDDVCQWFGKLVAGSVFSGLVTTDGTGYADIFRQPWHSQGQLTLHLHVAGPDRGRGLGTRLLDAIAERAVPLGGARLRTRVREQDAAGSDFAKRHGFEVRHHLFESRLDPASVDRELLLRPSPGVIVASLAELGDTEAHRHAFWELYERLAADMPGSRPRRSYAVFATQFFEASWFRAEAQFIALAGDEWIGVGALSYRPATNSLYHQLTGVATEYRGRHIASAIKRATIAYALEIGADYLQANNEATNAPMLAINRAYGYRPRPGYFDMNRTL